MEGRGGVGMREGENMEKTPDALFSLENNTSIREHRFLSVCQREQRRERSKLQRKEAAVSASGTQKTAVTRSWAQRRV